MTAGGPGLVLGGNSATVTYTANGPFNGTRTVSQPNASTGAVSIADSVAAFAGPVGLIGGVVATRSMTAGGIGLAAAQCLAAPVPCGILGTVGAGAMLIKGFATWAERNRVRNGWDAGKVSDGLFWDAGQPAMQSSAYMYAGPSNTWFIDPEAACNAHSNYNAYPGQYLEYHLTDGTFNQQMQSYSCLGKINGNGVTGFWLTRDLRVSDKCPAYVDAVIGAVAAGSPKGKDGKCHTGLYSSIAVEDAAVKIADPGISYPDRSAELSDMYKGINDWLHAGWPCEKCSAPAVSVTGPTTPIAGPGTQTVTQTAAQQIATNVAVAYMLEYGQVFDPGTSQTAGNISWSKRTTTTTTTTDKNPDGSLIAGSAKTNTETKTEGGAGAVIAGSQSDADAAKAVTQCDKYPDSVGCAKLGTAPTDVVPRRTETLSWQEETVNLPALCPSDRVMTMHGVSRAVSWAPTCQAAVNAKPWVLIGSAFSSLMLVVVALRSV